MIDTARITEPVAPRRLNDVQRANRSLLLFYLLPFPLFFIFDAFGLNEEVTFCLISVVILVALQRLLRGTADSPLSVLKRYREVSLPAVLGLSALVFLIDTGLFTFTDAFTPQLYNSFPSSEPVATWALPFAILGAAILTPFYEELIFRGLALRAYRNARSTLFAVLFTSALFSFIHGSLILTFVFFPSAILFALVVLKTGQLWTVIAVHALGNLVITLLIQFDVPAVSATPTSAFRVWRSQPARFG